MDVNDYTESKTGGVPPALHFLSRAKESREEEEQKRQLWTVRRLALRDNTRIAFKAFGLLLFDRQHVRLTPIHRLRPQGHLPEDAEPAADGGRALRRGGGRGEHRVPGAPLRARRLQQLLQEALQEAERGGQLHRGAGLHPLRHLRGGAQLHVHGAAGGPQEGHQHDDVVRADPGHQLPGQPVHAEAGADQHEDPGEPGARRPRAEGAGRHLEGAGHGGGAEEQLLRPGHGRHGGGGVPRGAGAQLQHQPGEGSAQPRLGVVHLQRHEAGVPAVRAPGPRHLPDAGRQTHGPQRQEGAPAHRQPAVRLRALPQGLHHRRAPQGAPEDPLGLQAAPLRGLRQGLHPGAGPEAARAGPQQRETLRLPALRKGLQAQVAPEGPRAAAPRRAAVQLRLVREGVHQGVGSQAPLEHHAQREPAQTDVAVARRRARAGGRQRPAGLEAGDRAALAQLRRLLSRGRDPRTDAGCEGST